MSHSCKATPRGPPLEPDCFYSGERCVWKLNSTTGCNCLQPQSVVSTIWRVCDSGLDPFRNELKSPRWEGDTSRPNSILRRLKLPPGCPRGASAAAPLHMQIVYPFPIAPPAEPGEGGGGRGTVRVPRWSQSPSELQLRQEICPT